MRILITGSRDWDDFHAVENSILGALYDAEVSPYDDDIVVVHGACPTGADAAADQVGRLWAFGVEAWPADWTSHGKAAGPIRNQQMVNAGADLCLAFPLGESRGTRDCVRRADAAGIPVLNYGDKLDNAID